MVTSDGPAVERAIKADESVIDWQEVDTAGAVAAQHGCAIEPGGDGRPHIVVMRAFQLGDPQDRETRRAARRALVAAGVFVDRMVGGEP